MLEKNLDIIYNKKYLVIIPKGMKHYTDGIIYSFGNTIELENTKKDYEKTKEFIEKNNFKKIIFVNYQTNYEQLIYNIKDKYELSFIYTGTLGGLSNTKEYDNFNKIFKLSSSSNNTTIGVIDDGLYQTLKNKYKNVKHIILDLDYINNQDETYKETSVGLLGEQDNPTNNFYNQLTALAIDKTYNAILYKINKVTKKFLKEFDIKYKSVKKEQDLIYNNLVNLYVNFTDTCNLLILKSMDNNVPCIVGNTTIFDTNEILKKHLVVESDDNSVEIIEKVKNINKNRTKILKEYKKFRKDYSTRSKESIENYLGYKKKETPTKEYEKLLTVVFPVYNVEKYIRKSLQSVVDARIDNMEILVINDGSPDNCHEIILEFVEKYPDLIRYIKQENHGLGYVRNVGLREAKGKYLAGVDSDDTINKSYFKDAEKYMKNDIDLIVTNLLTLIKPYNCETPAIDPIYKNRNLYEGLLYTTIMPHTGNKILKRALFDELKLNYIEDKYEDLSANSFIFLRAENIKYINKQYYEYYVRENSIMRSKPGNSMIHVIKLFEERLQKYKEYINLNAEEFKFNTYVWRIEEFIINPLYDLEEDEMLNSIKLIDKELKKILKDIINSKYYKEMLERLEDKEKAKFLKNRNKAINNNKFKEFVIEQRKTKKYQKLSAYEIIYGK